MKTRRTKKSKPNRIARKMMAEFRQHIDGLARADTQADIDDLGRAHQAEPTPAPDDWQEGCEDEAIA